MATDGPDGLIGIVRTFDIVELLGIAKESQLAAQVPDFAHDSALRDFVLGSTGWRHLAFPL